MDYWPRDRINKTPIYSIIPTNNIYLNPTYVCVAVKMKGYLFQLTISKKNGTKSLSEVTLQVGFNISPYIVVSHTVQGNKIISNLKVRNATCFVKMNPFPIAIFFILLSFDITLQKSGGPVHPTPRFRSH